MESIRRNFFNGVQCDERKITWIKWTKVLASKKYGGLGVLSSLYAFNSRALLQLGLGYITDGCWRFNGECVFRGQSVRILSDECFLPGKAPNATRGKIPRTCSLVADWLQISSGSYAAGGIYHGLPALWFISCDWLNWFNSSD
ncbi:hypothetical protein Tco_0385567 [Tanacetum coccineum]